MNIEMLNEQWPFVAILVVFFGIIVYAKAQASKNEQVATTIERRGGGVNRKPIRDAFQREIDSQTKESTGWENEVFGLHRAVGSQRTEVSRNLGKMAAGLQSVQRSGEEMNLALESSDAETKSTASNLGNLVEAAQRLKEEQTKSTKTDSRVKVLEAKVFTLTGCVSQLGNHLDIIHDAIVDEEGD
jgi:hypothetical protein